MVLEVDLRLFHFSSGYADFFVSSWMAIPRLQQYSFPAHSRRVSRRLLWKSLCFILFILFLALQCIIIGGSIAYTSLSRRRWGLVQLEAVMSCTVGDRDAWYGRRQRCLLSLETEMSCIAGDGDVSYAQRWLLTLVQADGIQPYWYVHIYTGFVAFLDRVQLSFLKHHYFNNTIAYARTHWTTRASTTVQQVMSTCV